MRIKIKIKKTKKGQNFERYCILWSIWFLPKFIRFLRLPSFHSFLWISLLPIALTSLLFRMLRVESPQHICIVLLQAKSFSFCAGCSYSPFGRGTQGSKDTFAGLSVYDVCTVYLLAMWFHYHERHDDTVDFIHHTCQRLCRGIASGLSTDWNTITLVCLTGPHQCHAQ